MALVDTGSVVTCIADSVGRHQHPGHSATYFTGSVPAFAGSYDSEEYAHHTTNPSAYCIRRRMLRSAVPGSQDPCATFDFRRESVQSCLAMARSDTRATEQVVEPRRGYHQPHGAHLESEDNLLYHTHYDRPWNRNYVRWQLGVIKREASDNDRSQKERWIRAQLSGRLGAE
ncbi:hypothetical protein CBL_20344 [Carabus blaptoides fortunei]